MFSSQTTNPAPLVLLPENRCEWVNLHVEGTKYAKESNILYFNIDLTILEGDFAKRRIYNTISSPWDPELQKPEKKNAFDFAVMSLTRIFESTGLFIPGNDASYLQFKQLEGSRPEDIASMVAARMTGHTVGVKIGVQPEQGRFAAKNVVKEWLSPNPDSKGYIGYQELMTRGQSGMVTSRQARSIAFQPLIDPNRGEARRPDLVDPALPPKGFAPPSSTQGYANVAQPPAWTGAPQAPHQGGVTSGYMAPVLQQPVQAPQYQVANYGPVEAAPAQVFVPANLPTPGNN